MGYNTVQTSKQVPAIRRNLLIPSTNAVLPQSCTCHKYRKFYTCLKGTHNTESAACNYSLLRRERKQVPLKFGGHLPGYTLASPPEKCNLWPSVAIISNLNLYSRIISTKSLHFEWQPSARVSQILRFLLPQSHDYRCYVWRRIMAPPTLGSLKLPATEAGEFAELILL